MTNQRNPSTHYIRAEEALSEPMRLDIIVYNFLLESRYAIHNDSGYLSMDQLIDDNPVFFEASFEQAVRKSLALISLSDQQSRLSSKKKRLRDNLLAVFENLRQFIARLGSDHLLLLNVFAIVFRQRIKIYVPEGSTFKSRIFGEKGAENKVRLLYDSAMFYILVKNHEPPLRRTQSSPSPVRTISRQSSYSPCRTIKILWDDLCNVVESKPNVQSSNSRHLSRRQSFAFQHRPKNKYPVQRSARHLRNSSEVEQSHRKATRQSPPLQPETHRHLSASASLKSSYHSANSWANLFHKLGQETSQINSCSIFGETSTKQTRPERGILTSYSASRQCGFILTDNELEVLVAQDELLRAGVPESMLCSSRNNIGHNVKFNLNLLSSEPIATFEATNLAFTQFLLQ
jgi:hypothetical protein